MAKSGIEIDIPGRGLFELRMIVTDYSGTLSRGGRLTDGVRDRLARLAEIVEIQVLTSDTFGTARDELAGAGVAIRVLAGERHDRQKERFITGQEQPAAIAAFGNGANDRLMLRAVRDAGGLAIAVDNGEGCAVETLLNSALLIHGAAPALDLLLDPRRLKADLRF